MDFQLANTNLFDTIDPSYDDNNDVVNTNSKISNKTKSSDGTGSKDQVTNSSTNEQSTSSNLFMQPSTSTITIEQPITNIAKIDEPIIHNIVSTANFCCSLDLSKIVVRVRNAEYNPKRFRAVIMRILEPRTTAMIFASGKIVCTGAKSERMSCLATRKYGRIIQKVGYEIKFSEFKIQNIVSTVDIKFPIRLDKLAIVHSQFCTYDPDFFPALIYRMVRPRTVLLIFVSGKIIITGAKSRTEIMETVNHMSPVLQSFRKQ